MSIDAMKQALEALEEIAWSNNTTWQSRRAQIEADALRERLSQPEQEPVAWVCYGSASDEKHAVDYQQEDIDAIPVGTMLYTAPRQWQGLTDVERNEFRQWAHPEIIEAIELKLRERNT